MEPAGERSRPAPRMQSPAPRELLDALPEAVLLTDATGSIVDANATLRSWYDLPQEGSFEPPETLTRAVAPLVEDALRQEAGERKETRLPVGEHERVVKIATSPLASGGLLVSMQDVTDLKATIDAALRQERVLEEAQKVAHIGSWTWDVQEDAVEWSDELYRIFGRDPETFEGTFEGYLANIHPEDLEHVQGVIKEGRESGDSFTFEHRIVRPDGEARMLHCRGQVITGPSGEPLRMVGTAQDITERYEAEERLREYATQLEQANRELEHFAYVASHDMKEPLRMVTSYVQMLEEHIGDKLDEDGQEYMDFVTNGTRRMHRLIQDLLAYSRIGQSDPEFAKIDLEPVLAEVKINLEPMIQEAHARVTWDDVPTIKGDEAQISLLLQNLVSNAIKFHREDQLPHVQIRVDDEGDTWDLEVQDNGIGFDPQYKDKIFRMFERLHNDEDFPGSGIGLAICKTIAESHGGEIDAETTPGEGTTFHVRLPKDPTHAQLDPRKALEQARQDLADAVPP